MKQLDPGLPIELIKGDRGVFDVRVDDRVIFSKKAIGRFPTAEEIRRLAAT